MGTFTPTGGEPASFRVYAEAEIEVEIEKGFKSVGHDDDDD